MPAVRPCRVSLAAAATVADLVEYLCEPRGCAVFGIDVPIEQTLKAVRFLRLCVDYQPVALRLDGRLLQDRAWLRQPPFVKSRWVSLASTAAALDVFPFSSSYRAVDN